MPLETATYLDDLVPANPENSDPVAQGADHLRLIKSTLRSTFPNLDGPVTATDEDLSAVPSLIANRARKDVADTFAALMTFTTGLDAASVRQNGTELLPPGVGAMWFDETAPAGYALLNGQAVSRTANPVLFARWGTRYGAGDGTTTFNLPNLQLRFPVMAGPGLGVNTAGGSQTPAVSVAGAGAHTHTVTTGGAHSHGGATAGHALTVAQLPAHQHTGNTAGAGEHQHGLGSGWANDTSQGSANINFFGAGTIGIRGSTDSAGHHAHAFTTDATGNNQAHAHGIVSDGAHTHDTASAGTHVHTATIADGRPPFFVVNFIVRLG